jgi:hypothetical protein
VPKGTFRILAIVRRIVVAIAKRSATLVNGGMPARPTRIAAQVVPQMIVRMTKAAARTS